MHKGDPRQSSSLRVPRSEGTKPPPDGLQLGPLHHQEVVGQSPSPSHLERHNKRWHPHLPLVDHAGGVPPGSSSDAKSPEARCRRTTKGGGTAILTTCLPPCILCRRPSLPFSFPPAPQTAPPRSKKTTVTAPHRARRTRVTGPFQLPSPPHGRAWNKRAAAGYSLYGVFFAEGTAVVFSFFGTSALG
jgi:hypothetical protein